MLAKLILKLSIIVYLKPKTINEQKKRWYWLGHVNATHDTKTMVKSTKQLHNRQHRNSVDVVYFDIAFDSIYFSTLLLKLSFYGFGNSLLK